MTLDEYMRTRAEKEEAFAAAIGVTQPAINNYRKGKRKPMPNVMERIIAVTGGLVTPNDFFLAELQNAKRRKAKRSAQDPRPGCMERTQ